MQAYAFKLDCRSLYNGTKARIFRLSYVHELTTPNLEDWLDLLVLAKTTQEAIIIGMLLNIYIQAYKPHAFYSKCSTQFSLSSFPRTSYEHEWLRTMPKQFNIHTNKWFTSLQGNVQLKHISVNLSFHIHHCESKCLLTWPYQCSSRPNNSTMMHKPIFRGHF